MAKSYVKVFFDWNEATSALSDAERGRLINGIVSYSRDGIDPNLGGREALLFPIFKLQIDRDQEDYESFCEKQRENGQKGGRPKKPNGFSENPTVFSETQKSQDKDKEEDKEEDKKEKDKRKKSFSPPTLEEVRTYCKERNSSVDPKRFFDYFEAGGWVDSKGNPVRNWKQKLLTWEAHGGRENVHGTSESSAKASAGQAWNLTGTYL